MVLEQGADRSHAVGAESIERGCREVLEDAVGDVSSCLGAMALELRSRSASSPCAAP